jgi:predicted transcriptional regulator
MARTSGHPKEESFNFRVPADLKAAFQKATEKSDRPAAQVIRDFMRAYVNEHQEPEAGHDQWFREKVQAALDNPSAGTPHNDVMNEIKLLLDKLSKDKNEN